MVVGKKINKHEIIKPNYLLWGTEGSTQIKQAVNFEMIDSIKDIVDLNYYHLSHSYIVDYFQNSADKVEVLWLRFTRTDNNNNQLYGEHITLLVNIESKQILGLTKMQIPAQDIIWVSHQVALVKAVDFLQKYAPDLINMEVEIPTLTKVSITTGLEFKPSIKLDQIEINWMDIHNEKLIINNQPVLIQGIKIKAYIPANKLWAWVIVAPNGEIMTFERNICWNFDLIKRQTQMWLHDAWLDAQKINI